MRKVLPLAFNQQTTMLVSLLQSPVEQVLSQHGSVEEVAAKMRGYPDYATYLTVEDGSIPGISEPAEFAQSVDYEWTIQDVHGERPDLTSREAAHVLFHLDKEDANDSITWSSISSTANELFKKRRFKVALHGRSPLIFTITGSIILNKDMQVKFTPDDAALAASISPDGFKVPDNCRLSFLSSEGSCDIDDAILFNVNKGRLTIDHERPYSSSLELRSCIANIVNTLDEKNVLKEVKKDKKPIAAEEQRAVIAATWTVHDVRKLRPDLTFYEAYLVLAEAERNFDANLGIESWLIEQFAEELFDVREFLAEILIEQGDNPSKTVNASVWFDSDLRCRIASSDEPLSLAKTQYKVRLVGTDDMPGNGWFNMQGTTIMEVPSFDANVFLKDDHDIALFFQKAIGLLSRTGMLQSIDNN